MILLERATYVYPGDRGPVTLLKDAEGVFLPGERVGILAAPGGGKSVVARLLAGIEEPTSGHVIRKGRISWPLGYAGGLHPELTLAQNAAVMAELAGADPEEMIAFCSVFGGLAEMMDRPLKAASPATRAILGYCCSVAIPADIYIADESLVTGDRAMLARSEALMTELLRRAGLVFLSRNPSQLKKHCTRFYVKIGPYLRPCATPELGAEALDIARSDGGRQMPQERATP